jgi:hypothetical protein
MENKNPNPNQGGMGKNIQGGEKKGGQPQQNPQRPGGQQGGQQGVPGKGGGLGK